MGSDDSPLGRLELTWPYKKHALLARDDGTYEWTPPHDHRVAEVRLLHDAGASVGEIGSVRAGDNLLIRGDALHALVSLTRLPEFVPHVSGKVKLAYIDPPFNTGQAFEHYDDGLEHSVWLTMMRDRLVQIKEMLASDGSVYVHLDDAEMAYCKVVMDEVFGRHNRIATFVWQKADTLRNDAQRASVSHDYILAYARDLAEFAMNRLPRTPEMDSIYRNPDEDERGAWLPGSLISPSFRATGDFEIVGPSGRTHRAPEGASWRMPRSKFDELLEDNRIWFGRHGDGVPQRKQFLSEMPGRAVDTLWSVKDVGGNRQSKAEIKALFPGVVPFSTPKPERLLERIMHIATDPGDLVLDCFAGSGTTAAVAHKSGRRWIAVEREGSTIEQFTAPRLSKVVRGEDPGGITEKVAWAGGGGFRILDVGPSMYEDDEGVVVLAEWATNSELQEAVAAQLGFTIDRQAPFCGRSGRVRLAVLDGHADERIVRQLASALGPREKLALCATSLDLAAAVLLTELSPGSSARLVPQDVVLAYSTPSAWQLSLVRAFAEHAANEASGLEDTPAEPVAVSDDA